MKTILLLLYVSVISLSNYSQYKSAASLSLIGGGFFPFEDFQPEIDPGYSIGVDIEHIANKFGLYINFSYNFTKEVKTYGTSGGKYGILDIHVGPRWIIGNKQKFHGVIDAGIGLYSFYFNNIRSNSAFGLNTGAGICIPLSDKFDLNFKGKLHILGKEYFTLYGGINCGLRYYFSKN